MKEQHFLVSYLSTNYSGLKRHWEEHSVLREKGIQGSNKPFTDKMGGKIELINWNEKEVVWEMSIDSPSGMLMEDETLFVNSINQGKILCINLKRQEIVGEINHPRFNKPHSITKTKNGLLITSTGLDSIIEVDNQGKTLFEVCLADDAYPYDQFGQRRTINKGINHQEVIYPSLNQTTHVNFARYENRLENSILATLFHQGELIKINKKNLDIQVLIEGLKNPHTINDYDDKHYLVCDTRDSGIIIMDKKSYQINKKLKNNFSWLQDAVLHNGNIYVADADHHRIVRITLTGDIVDEYIYSSEYRIYQLINAFKGDTL